MMKRLIAAFLCCALLLCLLPIHGRASTTIDTVSLTLDYPEAGNNPPGTATWSGVGYGVYAIDWKDLEEDRYLESGDKIQAGHQYAATIWVQADDGYVFKADNDNTPSISATVNGFSVTPEKAYEYKAWAMVTLTYYFSYVPEKGWIESVELAIPAPAAGELPYYEQVRTGTYHLGNVYFSGETNPNMKNGICWWETDSGLEIPPESGQTYLSNTAYTLNCLVFPEEGYRIAPSAKVTVNGSRAKASLDYDTFLSVLYDFPATGNTPVHTHTPGDWRYNVAEHYRYCTDCGEMLDVEDHKGGKATCVEKGTCEICGYAYLPENEDHIPESKWTACANLYHAHLCKLCGAHCTPEAHIPGAAATESSPQKCTVCGYILAPALNHTHKLTRVEEVPATCLKDGVMLHYTCSGCNGLFADEAGKTAIADVTMLTIPATGHTESTEWGYDQQEHWKQCAICHESMTETRQEHDLKNGKCTLCGYDEEGATESTAPGTEEATDPTKPTESTAPTQPQKPAEKKNPLTWLLPVGIGVICFVGAIVAALLIRKKRQA